MSKNKTGYQFNRQFAIDNYIVDFISRKLKLIIEVGGYSHRFKKDADDNRDKTLKALGYRIIRFTEHDVKYNFTNVKRAIDIFIYEFEIEKETIPTSFTKEE